MAHDCLRRAKSSDSGFSFDEHDFMSPAKAENRFFSGKAGGALLLSLEGRNIPATATGRTKVPFVVADVTLALDGSDGEAVLPGMTDIFWA